MTARSHSRARRNARRRTRHLAARRLTDPDRAKRRRGRRRLADLLADLPEENP